MSEDRRIRKTKAAVKNTLIELLKTKPLNKISVTKLTTKADISRKTFYLHYDSVFDAKNDIDNDIIKLLEDIIATLPDTLEENGIITFFTLLYEKAKTHERLNSYFLQESNRTDLYASVKATLKKALLTRFENSNMINSRNDYIAEFIVGGVLNAYIEWSFKRDLPSEEITLLMTSICTSISPLLIEN